MAYNDVTAAFEGFTTGVILKRAQAGDYSTATGLFSPGGLRSTSNIDAVVQSASSDDLLTVPEGLRTTESLKLHTKVLLKTVSEVGETEADLIVADGLTWLAQSVANRNQAGGYYKTICIRVKDDHA